MSSVDIVYANANHEDDIKEMLGLFFETDFASVSYLNTQHNVDQYYTHVILPLIMRGDPVLLAIKDGEAVGLNCLSTELNEHYDLKYKTIHGIMTFIKEGYRRKGIAMSMKQYLFKWVKRMGYERAIGEWVGDNVASHAHSDAAVKEFNATIDRKSTQYVVKL